MGSLKIRDDLGDTVTLDGIPERIVSLVPSLTETIVRLGALDRLAGITRYCTSPAGALDGIPRVGGTKSPLLEKILSLEPDLVVANAEENEKIFIEDLKKSTSVFVTYPRTVQGAIKTVQDLGRLTGQAKEADSWALECKELMTSLLAEGSAKTFRTACLIWRKPWMAAGSDTYMSDLLQTFGFKNIFSLKEGRYPKTDLQTLINRKPDVILLPDEPFRFNSAHQKELEDHFARASFFPLIVLAEGMNLAWFGWRTLEALTYVSDISKSLAGGDAR